MDTRERYRKFAEWEARGQSPTYERLALAVATDAGLRALLDELPEPKRQPNLLFGATRFLGGPVDDADRFRGWLTADSPEVAATMLARRTQTNEAAQTEAAEQLADLDHDTPSAGLAERFTGWARPRG